MQTVTFLLCYLLILNINLFKCFVVLQTWVIHWYTLATSKISSLTTTCATSTDLASEVTAWKYGICFNQLLWLILLLTRPTQPCIPTTSLNWVPASAGVKAGNGENCQWTLTRLNDSRNSSKARQTDSTNARLCVLSWDTDTASGSTASERRRSDCSV